MQKLFIKKVLGLPAKLRLRVEGPFDSNYSLAIVNRNFAFGIERNGHDVCLTSSDGPGDFPPNAEFLHTHPHERELWEKSTRQGLVLDDVVSRYMYPPRVNDMHGRINIIHCYGWEESAFPQEYVDNFNSYLDVVFTASSFVRKILIDNGVTVPVFVAGHGIDHWKRIIAEPFAMKAKKFRFLHISSCFPRKGADVLLRAYGRAFTSQDDISLIIKTFPNPHNEIYKWLREAKGDRTDFPDVIILEDDLPPEQLKGLMEGCDALVAPSRGEGFGLPLAEAMITGLAVITTNYSGQTMFCTPETAWLVDYTPAPSETHLELSDSYWAEPDEHDLARAMKEVHGATFEERQKRICAAATLLQDYTWDNVAKTVVSKLRQYTATPTCPPPRIGWVTTWNTRCGIATYSKHLLKYFPEGVTIFAPLDPNHFEDDDSVVRCWMREDNNLKNLEHEIYKNRIQVLVIQFNFAFFYTKVLSDFIINLKKNGILIFLVLHSTTEDPSNLQKKLEYLLPGLRLADSVLVHSINDVARLKNLGITENITLFSHGIMPVLKTAVKPDPLLIATYGFSLPHKGLEFAIRAIALLRKRNIPVKLRMLNAEYPLPISANYILEIKELIRNLGLSDFIEYNTQFLTDQESLQLLQDASIILFPYQSATDSASGAVRGGLSSGRPVATTPIPMFDDVKDAIHLLTGCTTEDIAQGLESLLTSISAGDSVFLEKEAKSAQWRDTHGFDRKSKQLYGMIYALFRDSRLDI